MTEHQTEPGADRQSRARGRASNKNILATVLATVRLSIPISSDDLKQLIEGRIDALAKVHTLFVDPLGGSRATTVWSRTAFALQRRESARAIDGPAVMPGRVRSDYCNLLA